MAAFELGLKLGAGGIECEVWATADGTAVLHPEGRVGGRFRRRSMAEVSDADLPAGVVTLEALYQTVGPRADLLLQVQEPAVVPAVVELARRHAAEDRLWLGHSDPELLASWRDLANLVRLVNITRMADMEQGPERRAAQLRELGVDAVSLDQSEWSAGLVSLFHRFRRRTVATGAQHERIILAMLDAGIDGVVGDHVDRLVDTAARAAQP